MGSNNSTRRVSFEADENDNVTIVKGIRLSENVINRMRESASSALPQQEVPTASQYSQTLAPRLPPVHSNVSPMQPPPLAASPPVTPTSEPAHLPPPVDEEELRRKISQELQRGLEQEKKRSELDLQRLEQERAQAQAWTHAQVQQEVGRILEAERAAAQDSIKRALLKERVTAEDERMRAQFYAQQLEERDRDLRKHDAFYKGQVTKLEERSAQFCKVTAENYNKAVNNVNSRFKCYEINPICADLQEEVLKCYRENTGHSLTCSNIASLYLQCVNSAKQNKLRTGG